MKQTFSAIVLLLAAAVSASAQQSIQFANLPWGATRAETKRSLVDSGFVFEKLDNDGDLMFSGTIPNLGERAVVVAYFAPDDNLVKVDVNIAPPDHRVLEVYRSVKESLTELYGEPTRQVERFSYPYANVAGDVGREITAIRDGKAIIASLWGGHPPQDGLALDVTDQLLDRISYESAQWSAELARRKKLANGY
jgi:hypothetical protein